MRTQDDVKQMLDFLCDEPGGLDWRGDTFKYGYLIGKIAALEWVLDEGADLAGKDGNPSRDYDIKSHFDIEDWMRELTETAEELKMRLRDK